MPKTGLEPARCETHAPETCASTNSATWALNLNLSWFIIKNNRAENGNRTRDPNLGKVVLYQLSYFRMLLIRSTLYFLHFVLASAKISIIFYTASIFVIFLFKNWFFCLFSSFLPVLRGELAHFFALFAPHCSSFAVNAVSLLCQCKNE